MQLFARLHEALISDDVSLKARVIDDVLEYCNTVQEEENDFLPERFETPSYARRCRIVPPKELPKRRKLHTREGLAILLHSILHIEYSAIDLALDAVYRFPRMPREYRIDWLEVAAEEVRHFRMLEEILAKLGYGYGDFPVHRGLFDASMHTAEDVLDRMAVIPRHYEATGLDVNPQIMHKLSAHRGEPYVAEVLDALEIIYREEIDHVRKGDRWFRQICQERGLEEEETFVQILERFSLGGRQGRVLNVEARKEAGFRCNELLRLGARECRD